MLGFSLNFFFYAVSAEKKHAACWDRLKRFHKNHALAAQLIDHHRVMDNLMPYIDRRAETRERALDNFNRAIHAGGKAARMREQHPKVGGAKGWDDNHAPGQRQ